MKYEADESIPKKVINAKQLLISLITERMNTGRIYVMNIDNANMTPFLEKISMSNLCLSGNTLVDVEVTTNLRDIQILDTLEQNGDVFIGKMRMDVLDSIFNRFTQEGDSYNMIRVLSKNVETDVIEYNKITASAEMNSSAKVMRITDEETGKSIVCTPEHKIWTKKQRICVG